MGRRDRESVESSDGQIFRGPEYRPAYRELLKSIKIDIRNHGGYVPSPGCNLLEIPIFLLGDPKYFVTHRYPGEGKRPIFYFDRPEIESKVVYQLPAGDKLKLTIKNKTPKSREEMTAKEIQRDNIVTSFLERYKVASLPNKAANQSESQTLNSWEATISTHNMNSIPHMESSALNVPTGHPSHQFSTNVPPPVYAPQPTITSTMMSFVPSHQPPPMPIYATPPVILPQTQILNPFSIPPPPIQSASQPGLFLSSLPPPICSQMPPPMRSHFSNPVVSNFVPQVEQKQLLPPPIQSYFPNYHMKGETVLKKVENYSKDVSYDSFSPYYTHKAKKKKKRKSQVVSSAVKVEYSAQNKFNDDKAESSSATKMKDDQYYRDLAMKRIAEKESLREKESLTEKTQTDQKMIDNQGKKDVKRQMDPTKKSSADLKVKSNSKAVEKKSYVSYSKKHVSDKYGEKNDQTKEKDKKKDKKEQGFELSVHGHHKSHQSISSTHGHKNSTSNFPSSSNSKRNIRNSGDELLSSKSTRNIFHDDHFKYKEKSQHISNDQPLKIKKRKTEHEDQLSDISYHEDEDLSINGNLFLQKRNTNEINEGLFENINRSRVEKVNDVYLDRSFNEDEDSRRFFKEDRRCQFISSPRRDLENSYYDKEGQLKNYSRISRSMSPYGQIVSKPTCVHKGHYSAIEEYDKPMEHRVHSGHGMSRDFETTEVYDKPIEYSGYSSHRMYDDFENNTFLNSDSIRNSPFRSMEFQPENVRHHNEKFESEIRFFNSGSPIMGSSKDFHQSDRNDCFERGKSPPMGYEDKQVFDDCPDINGEEERMHAVRNQFSSENEEESAFRRGFSPLEEDVMYSPISSIYDDEDDASRFQKYNKHLLYRDHVGENKDDFKDDRIRNDLDYIENRYDHFGKHKLERGQFSAQRGFSGRWGNRGFRGAGGGGWTVRGRGGGGGAGAGAGAGAGRGGWTVGGGGAGTGRGGWTVRGGKGAGTGAGRGGWTIRKEAFGGGVVAGTAVGGGVVGGGAIGGGVVGGGAIGGDVVGGTVRGGVVGGGAVRGGVVGGGAVRGAVFGGHLTARGKDLKAVPRYDSSNSRKFISSKEGASKKKASQSKARKKRLGDLKDSRDLRDILQRKRRV